MKHNATRNRKIKAKAILFANVKKRSVIVWLKLLKQNNKTTRYKKTKGMTHNKCCFQFVCKVKKLSVKNPVEI